MKSLFEAMRERGYEPTEACCGPIPRDAHDAFLYERVYVKEAGGPRSVTGDRVSRSSEDIFDNHWLIVAFDQPVAMKSERWIQWIDLIQQEKYQPFFFDMRNQAKTVLAFGFADEEDAVLMRLKML
jgi:hypothetical protein